MRSWKDHQEHERAVRDRLRRRWIARVAKLGLPISEVARRYGIQRTVFYREAERLAVDTEEPRKGAKRRAHVARSRLTRDRLLSRMTDQEREDYDTLIRIGRYTPGEALDSMRRPDLKPLIPTDEDTEE